MVIALMCWLGIGVFIAAYAFVNLPKRITREKRIIVYVLSFFAWPLMLLICWNGKEFRRHFQTERR